MMADPRIVDFFDARADGYAQRNAFVRRLHQARAAQALAWLPSGIANPAILDIGCGDGILYQLLQARCGSSFYYYGIDPSAAMLAAGSIPAQRRYCGYVAHWTPPDGAPPFDLICWLGVSTYVAPHELQRDLAHAADWLAPNGKIIISFTHALNGENTLRRWLAPLAARLLPGRRVLSAPFSTFHYTPEEALAFAGNRFEGSVVWLAPSIPFLHHLSPRLAHWGSRALGWLPAAIKSTRWHSDFLVILRQK
jgi:SAM-dependent methyltransferase